MYFWGFRLLGNLLNTMGHFVFPEFCTMVLVGQVISFYKDVKCVAISSHFCCVFQTLRQQEVNPQS